jgi:hypothetical protein
MRLASWDEALTRAAAGFRAAVKTEGPAGGHGLNYTAP